MNVEIFAEKTQLYIKMFNLVNTIFSFNFLCNLSCSAHKFCFIILLHRFFITRVCVSCIFWVESNVFLIIGKQNNWKLIYTTELLVEVLFAAFNSTVEFQLDLQWNKGLFQIRYDIFHIIKSCKIIVTPPPLKNFFVIACIKN